MQSRPAAAQGAQVISTPAPLPLGPRSLSVVPACGHVAALDWASRFQGISAHSEMMASWPQVRGLTEPSARRPRRLKGANLKAPEVTQFIAMQPKDLACVVVDTTVQPKAVMFPTDAKLF